MIVFTLLPKLLAFWTVESSWQSRLRIMGCKSGSFRALREGDEWLLTALIQPTEVKLRHAVLKHVVDCNQRQEPVRLHWIARGSRWKENDQQYSSYPDTCRWSSWNYWGLNRWKFWIDDWMCLHEDLSVNSVSEGIKLTGWCWSGAVWNPFRLSKSNILTRKNTPVVMKIFLRSDCIFLCLTGAHHPLRQRYI